MKKFVFYTAIIFNLLSPISNAEAKNYYYRFNDKDSKISFHADTSMHSFDGLVQKFKGYINLKADSNDINIEKAEGLLEIKVDGLFTNQSLRDTRMKNDILNRLNFPLIVFKVTDAKMTNKSKENGTIYLKLIGNLKIRDVSKNIEIPVKVKLSQDKETAEVDGKYSINFKEYNIPDPSLPIIGIMNENIQINFLLKAR